MERQGQAQHQCSHLGLTQAVVVVWINPQSELLRGIFPQVSAAQVNSVSGSAGASPWVQPGGRAAQTVRLREPRFSAAMMVSVIEVHDKGRAKIQVSLPMAVAAERPGNAHRRPTAPLPRPPPSDRLQQQRTAIRPGPNEMDNQTTFPIGYPTALAVLTLGVGLGKFAMGEGRIGLVPRLGRKPASGFPHHPHLLPRLGGRANELQLRPNAQYNKLSATRPSHRFKTAYPAQTQNHRSTQRLPGTSASTSNIPKPANRAQRRTQIDT